MNEQDYYEILENLKKKKEINGFQILEGILYKQDEKNQRLLKVIRRYELEPIMYFMHDHSLSAHFGIQATKNKVKEKYYWPGMSRDIEDYVKSCDQCQRRGRPNNKHELHSIEIKEPFYYIGIDIVGPLPITKNNNRYIVVAVDYFTKWPEAKAIKNANAIEVAEFIFEDIICRHGCPKKILTDRGSHFNNEMIKEITKKFNIRHNFSTPYHPQTNGLVERFNKTLCESLAKLEKEAEWDKNIAPVLFAYRNKKQESSKLKPFYVVYGREVKTIFNQESVPEKENWIQYLVDERSKILEQVRENVKKSQENQKKYHDKKIKTKTFTIGEKVLYYKAAKEKQWSGKLEEKWKGPYYIHEVLMNGAYRLKDYEGNVVKVPVNGEYLKKYHSREGYVPYVLIEPGGSN